VKAKELRDLTIDELKQRDKELREEQFNLKFQAATSQLSNTAKDHAYKKRYRSRLYIN